MEPTGGEVAVASAERPRGAASTWRRLARSSRARDLGLLLAIVVGLGSLWAVTTGHRSTDDGAATPPASSIASNVPAAQAPPVPARAPSQTPSRVVTPVKELKRLLAECQGLTVPADLVVVTYNIKSGHYGGRSRLAGVIAELTTMQPDIVFLQEVRGAAQLRAISTALGLAEVYGVNLRLGRGVGTSEYGTAILSRFPVEDPVNVRLPNRPGLEQRGLLRASVLVEGTPLTLYGTHLQHTSAQMRAAQMRVILDLVRDDPAAKILGGDLNDSPRSGVLGSAYTELQDTWTAVGVGSGDTVPAARPRNRIDYLLFGQADDKATTLAPLTAQVMGVGSSDHRAIRATFRLTRQVEPACRS
jgi:endonuclease/exonuclease/phosphatase family metal-dependent hydrolase